MFDSFLDAYWGFLLDKFSIFGTFIGLAGLALGAIIAIAAVLFVLLLPILIPNAIKDLRSIKQRKRHLEEMRACMARNDLNGALAAAGSFEISAEKHALDEKESLEIGIFYAHLNGNNKVNNEKAVKYLRPLAQAGNNEAMYEMVQLLRGGIKMDPPTEGFTYLRTLAEAKFRDSESILDEIEKHYAFETELGMTAYSSEMYEMAWNILYSAAQWGNAKAQSDVAYMLDNGIGVKKDEETALFWYKEAAKNGRDDVQGIAQYNIGVTYITKEMYTEAFELFKKAADLHVTPAYHYLAWLYYNGKGTEKNLYWAHDYAKKSVDSGNDATCHVYGAACIAMFEEYPTPSNVTEYLEPGINALYKALNHVNEADKKKIKKLIDVAYDYKAKFERM